MSANSQTFSVGKIATSETVLYAQLTPGKKAVVEMFRLIRNSEVSPINLELFFTHNKTKVRILPINFSLEEQFLVDILSTGEQLTLQYGDSLTGKCDVGNSLDFILTGELHEDLQ